MSSGGGPSDAHQVATSALRALSLASAMCRLYPTPTTQPAFHRAVETLTAIALEGAGLRFGVARDHFAHDGVPVESDDPSLEWLATSLFEHDVAEIVLRAAPSAEEVVAFAALAVASEQEVQEAGGPRGFLGIRGVTSIQVVPRDLKIGGRAAVADDRSMPDLLHGLVGHPRDLAAKIEAAVPEPETFAHLKDLYERGVELGIASHLVTSALVDALAAMSESRTASTLDTAFADFNDEFAQALVGQFSDGELAESFRVMARSHSITTLMERALRVVGLSGGRRAELPSVVAKRLVDSAFDRDEVFEAFSNAWTATRRNPPTPPGQTLSLKDAETLPDLDAMRAEAESGFVDDGFETGLQLLTSLLGTTDLGDIDALSDLAETVVTQHVDAGRPALALRLLETVADAASIEIDPLKRERLERAMKAALSRELISTLLTGVSDEEGLLRRLLDSLKERTVPALVAQLGAEQSQQRRRLLIDLLAEVAAADPSEVVNAVDDPRWFLVRNLITVLGRIGATQTLPAVLHAAGHDDPRVRRESMRALSGAGPAGVGALGDGTRDSDESVRLAAIASLGTVDTDESRRILGGIAAASGAPVRERREALNSLRVHSNDQARAIVTEASRRKWPPSSSTKQVALHARDLLERWHA